MRNRQQLENTEINTLESFAAVSAQTQGRQYKEDEHPYRTAFQRDRDRIIHSSAFRRLEYKTQVFINHEGDYYRTRLTHTMEVSQIARTCARTLGVNEDLADAIALAHDLGHTPFGHSGQDMMNELMNTHGGFEHNKQSFRIVTHLENPYPYFRGLNLSYEVLEGICKHASEYDMPDKTLFVKDGYPSIEAQIANVADEIAYNNHDIDDGLKSGLLQLEDLNDVDLWKMHFDEIQNQYTQISATQKRRFTVKAIINHLVTDLLQNTEKNIREQSIFTRDDVKTRGKNLVSFSDTTQKQNAQLKSFLYSKLYCHYRVLRMQEKAKTVLKDLFYTYAKTPALLPPIFTSFYTQEDPMERVICDYIAGMTDRFALSEHDKLFNPKTRV